MKFILFILGAIVGAAGVLLAMAAGWLDPIRPEHPPKKDEWGQFPSKPHVELLDNGRELRLLEDFAYLDPQGKVWAAKKNSVVDGASIPKLFWSITGGPLEGEFRNASIVHDTACHSKMEPWEDVHYMFYQACRCGGLLENKAKAMYAAVYHFGPRWELRTVKEIRIVIDEKGKERKKVVMVQASKAIAPPTPAPDVRERLEKYIAAKNPSLDELKKLDPNKL
jgi:hypothetical protein